MQEYLLRNAQLKYKWKIYFPGHPVCLSDAPFYRAGFQSRLAGDELKRQRKKNGGTKLPSWSDCICWPSSFRREQNKTAHVLWTLAINYVDSRICYSSLRISWNFWAGLWMLSVCKFGLINFQSALAIMLMFCRPIFLFIWQFFGILKRLKASVKICNRNLMTNGLQTKYIFQKLQ